MIIRLMEKEQENEKEYFIEKWDDITGKDDFVGLLFLSFNNYPCVLFGG